MSRTATHTFLYADGEGFHFMNPESYDQIAVAEDVVGDEAPYLIEGMPVVLSLHEGVADRHRAAAARDLRGGRDRADHQGPDGVVLLQAGDAVERSNT